ncbi:MAG TPA: SDR family NAD(P)-dependent oxidoreductase [bacterium]|nr:SDR family NAD(P)-dependent oxidoreductase [bacterium]
MRFRGKNVLITGGAGFVGSNLVDQLVEEGARVTVLDDLFSGRKENIAHFREITFIQGCVTDVDKINQLVQENELVFNLAVRNIIVSTVSPELDFQVNTGGMFNILLAAKKFGVERIVYTSSASVYGNSRYLPINEDDHISTLNPYAASKLSAENYCHAFFETYDVPMAIVRYSNVYGKKQSPTNPYCGVVSKFFESLMNGQSPQIHGDGEQTRDFTYVADAVEATLLAAYHPRAVGEVFNVGSGKETSINELVSRIIEIIGTKARPQYIDRRDIDNIRRRVLNIEKSRKILRWSPTRTLENGLRETHEWLSSIR